MPLDLLAEMLYNCDLDERKIMPHYNFQLDLPVAQQTEREVAEKLEEYYGWRLIQFWETGDFDLLMKKGDKTLTIEVKEDFTCEKTGNICLEFECRGKPSGIRATNALCYIYKIHTKNGIKYRGITTKELKNMVLNHDYFKIVVGGDSGSHSKNFLFKYEVFCEHSMKLFS